MVPKEFGQIGNDRNSKGRVLGGTGQVGPGEVRRSGNRLGPRDSLGGGGFRLGRWSRVSSGGREERGCDRGDGRAQDGATQQGQRGRGRFDAHSNGVDVGVADGACSAHEVSAAAQKRR